MKRPRLLSTLRAFRRDEQGVVAVLFGVMAMVFVVLAAVAIDVGNAYRIRNALQSSLDAAMLAAGTDPKEDEEYLKGEVRRFFDQNIASALGEGAVTVTVFNFTFNTNTNRMRANLRARSATLFWGVLDERTMLHTIESAVQRPPPMEMAIVIDESPATLFHIPGTGWSVTHLDAQKKIAVDLISLFLRYNDTKIGLVPYASLVNTGRFVSTTFINIKNPTWASLPAAWTGCVGYRLGGYAANLDSPRTAKYPGYLMTDPPLLQPSPIGPGDPANLTKMPFCGTRMMQLFDKSRQQTLISVVNSITAQPPAGAGSSSSSWSWVDGNGIAAIGLIWGWNILTSEPPFDQARTKEFMQEVGGKKIAVLISYSSTDRSYGPARDGQTGINEAMVMNGVQLTREICRNMKNDGIIVYTVQMANAGPIDDAFRECASDPDKFFVEADMYTGTNNSELKPEAISQEIARQLLSPRLIQ